MAEQNNLKQTVVSPTVIKEIGTFVRWLNTTKNWRKVHSGLHGCTDPQLKSNMAPLCRELNISEDTANVFRTSAGPSPIYSSKGTIHIIPLQGSGRISGQEVQIGRAVTYNEAVSIPIEPPLDILVSTEEEAEEAS
ncbi:hypothetical protein K469DRAFT_327195 [Zopfia rhizophila CBS 207.26]|uniref:Uncharacterized protein n=1 Tax=Zopfia rhizophila CBS 207.26 TaxID=1314779 RepID=A0A6A6DGX0_9PEZI|nr:hypothetical protein K469DRAFT_327195 [Zopfia rhizophila CBS 207.26]